MDTPEHREQETFPHLKSLYRSKNISIRALDTVIVLGLAAIVIIVCIALQDPGFTVTFDSCGGSDVASQKLQYGELLTDVEEPTREGYRFTGWYLDTYGQLPWDLSTDTVTQDITLYAGWESE